MTVLCPTVQRNLTITIYRLFTFRIFFFSSSSFIPHRLQHRHRNYYLINETLFKNCFFFIIALASLYDKYLTCLAGKCTQFEGKQGTIGDKVSRSMSFIGICHFFLFFRSSQLHKQRKDTRKMKAFERSLLTLV